MSKLNPSAKPFSPLSPNAPEFRPAEDIRTYVNTKTGQEVKIDKSKVPNVPNTLVEKKGGRMPIDDKSQFMNQEPKKNAPMRVAGRRKRTLRKPKRRSTMKSRKIR